MDKEKQEKNQRWYLRIQEYAESELSQRAWCKSQGISTSTFSYWYRKFGNLITNERSKENFFQIGTMDTFFSDSKQSSYPSQNVQVSKVTSSVADASQPVRVTYGEFSIELPLHAEPTALLNILRVVKSV